MNYEERAFNAENECERLRARVEDLEAITAQPEIVAKLQARVAELEADRRNLLDTTLVARACVSLQKDLNTANKRAEHAEVDLAAARALLVKAVPLLREVVIIHADPEDPNYNGCDGKDERCMWCEGAQTIIDAALAEGKP